MFGFLSKLTKSKEEIEREKMRECKMKHCKKELTEFGTYLLKNHKNATNKMLKARNESNPNVAKKHARKLVNQADVLKTKEYKAMHKCVVKHCGNTKKGSK